MAFEAVFLDLMPSTVSVSTRASHNAYGEPSFGSGTDFRARIVHQPGFVRGTNDETIEYTHVIWVASTGTIDVSARITLPDGTTPIVRAVERYPDTDGTHHHKLMCGF